MRARRTAATIALASIIMAACGSGDTDTPAATADNDPVPPAAEEQPAPTEPATSAESGDEGAEGATAEDDIDADDASDEAALPPADDAPESEVAEGVDDSSQPETVPEPADDPLSMAWPDDGCSADNSPTPTDLADAPVPLLELRAESAASPLPEVAVRRLNCNGGWVNFRNELPSELPLLVWFWAPH